MKYQFVSDTGHGWLAVPMATIRALNLESRITPYSYWDATIDCAWLEEDCDVTQFLLAIGAAGHGTDTLRQWWTDNVTETVTDGRSHVRNLPAWQPPRHSPHGSDQRGPRYAAT